MNNIFHELNIDDVIVKYKNIDQRLIDLEEAFYQNKALQYLKMNPIKCAFEVLVGYFLNFLVHHKGIEVDKNKVKAILEARLSRNKKEL